MSGAGVVHYQLLHRPRSDPTALGPAPLVTVIFHALSAIPIGESSDKVIAPDEFMNCKKAHEVQAMSEVVASLAKCCQVKQVKHFKILLKTNLI